LIDLFIYLFIYLFIDRLLQVVFILPVSPDFMYVCQDGSNWRTISIAVAGFYRLYTLPVSQRITTDY